MKNEKQIELSFIEKFYINFDYPFISSQMPV